MLLVSQIKLKPGFSEEELRKKTASILKVFDEDIISMKIEKMSVDARKKPDIFIIVSVSCEVKHETSIMRRNKSDQVTLFSPIVYRYSVTGNEKLEHRPVVIGAGPAGLFAAYFLAKSGYKPIVLERGYDIDSRTKDVEDFWTTGRLNTTSNVQFGEGGAGAFSDGKLNTLVKDKFGRNKAVLDLFVESGANPDILIESKPHIGTDVLVEVVKNIREKTKKYGGEFRFNAEVTDIIIENGSVKAVEINGVAKLDTDVVVLAIGHSARNTFEMLYDKKIKMLQKDFAVGLRVEHPQSMINKAMYGTDETVWKKLPVAPYKLTYQASNNRGVYSFCMCPGGYVVNASSESERTCVNGMSYKDRAGKHANSAIIVTVTSSDFGSDHPLAGMEFQRRLEERAYILANGNIPVEYYGKFKSEVKSGLADVASIDPNDILANKPECKGQYTFTTVSDIMPKECNEAFVEGMEAFGKIIPGFNNNETIVSGIESRTSSPIRISRNEYFESESTKGLYPCGEGAGYAGGIMSAAMDGIKVFEAIIAKYAAIGD